MGTVFAYSYTKSNNIRPGLLLLAFTVFFSILSCASVAFGQVDVSLAWDASSGADGYRLFYREDGHIYNYGSPDWEGTATTCTVFGLDESKTYHFVVRAFNEYVESGDSNEATWEPADVNNPPVLNPIGSKSVGEGNLLTFTVTASDPDGDGLTLSASNVPTGASFSPSSQVFSWTPDYGDAGIYNVQFTVTDNGTPAESDLEIVPITVVEPPASNLPPDQPIIASPHDGEMETDLLLTVETEPFSDPDGDTHKETQWQIVKAADSSVVLEIVSNEHLTAISVPHAVLDRNTTYNVSVQFFDVYDEPSPWSDPVVFTTHNSVVDYDDDGIPDDREVDDTVDLNEDGTPDNDQPDVIKSAKSAVAGKKPFGICKIETNVDSIVVLEPIHPSEIMDKKNKPKKFLYGLAAYRLKVNQVGATTQVKVYFSEDISETSGYYIYDTINGWQDYTQYTIFNPDRRSVTVELQDGGHGDSDGVANGIIVDPGGVVGAATDGLDPGAGGGCFIASATLGSSMEPNLKLHAASYLARIFHVLLSRDHEDGRATGQPSRGTAGLVPRREAYLNGTSQGPIPEDARKDGH